MKLVTFAGKSSALMAAAIYSDLAKSNEPNARFAALPTAIRPTLAAAALAVFSAELRLTSPGEPLPAAPLFCGVFALVSERFPAASLGLLLARTPLVSEVGRPPCATPIEEASDDDA
jgi:hypothetical protein